MNNDGLTLDPETMLCDFGLGIAQAGAFNLPSATHRGPYYQFMQAIWKKVKAFGSADEYKTINQEFKTSVQKMVSVVFCPSTFVYTVWFDV